MHEHVAVFRTGDLLKEGCRKLKELWKEQKDIYVLQLSLKIKLIKVSDKSLIYNTDLIETWEFENLMLYAVQIAFGAEARTESRGAHARNDFKQRIDEYDYSKPIENQEKLPLDKHWRKHTISSVDLETGDVY